MNPDGIHGRSEGEMKSPLSASSRGQPVTPCVFNQTQVAKHAPEQTAQSLKSEDYKKSSDKFKWPEEISIHLGPVSSKPAVREREGETERKANPSYDRCISDEWETVHFV